MLMTYKDHINLGFFLGAKLNSRLLEGSGKGLRHIKVRNEGDIKNGEFSKLLKEAAKLYWSGQGKLAMVPWPRKLGLNGISHKLWYVSR